MHIGTKKLSLYQPPEQFTLVAGLGLNINWGGTWVLSLNYPLS